MLWVLPGPAVGRAAVGQGPLGPGTTATTGPRSRRALRLGGVAGAGLLAATAWHAWGVREVVALAIVALVGALVGAATGLGVARTGAPPPPTASVPEGAVELPWSVARAAPDDATGDELVLWATRAGRLRRAREALLGGGGGPEPHRASAATVSDRLARAEREHERARAEWAPVGELLGLPDP